MTAISTWIFKYKHIYGALKLCSLHDLTLESTEVLSQNSVELIRGMVTKIVTILMFRFIQDEKVYPTSVN